MLLDATCMKSAGIKICQIYSYMAELVGGYGKLSFLLKDMYSRVAKNESLHLKNADAARTIGYFQHKADHDVDCFCRFSYDGNNRLFNVMWAYSKSQEYYHLFGHSVAFDCTYKTNAYGKPLLVWLRVNNHFRSTIFGYALLSDKSSDTYTWATKIFIDYMGGVTPKTVVTDGDQAIRHAINVTMLEVVHRLCYWHIHKKVAIAVKDPETRDAKDDYDTMNTMSLLQQTNMAHIEEEAEKLYARNMFFRVRAQIEKEARCMVDSSTKEDDMVVVRLTKTPLFDTVHRTVYLDLLTGSIEDGYEEPRQCDKNMEYDLNNPRFSKNEGTEKVAGAYEDCNVWEDNEHNGVRIEVWRDAAGNATKGKSNSFLVLSLGGVELSIEINKRGKQGR
ncbi:hypothetical protein F8388_011052 [Cannabis sativa]|uniref:MULE transposase domain-containing protein n=1 Tax=Cannabis sativa TaxID=3483 RepID=A0A7J6FQW3_CANSA|nr:hypothetical protein F8388_011052 [Cannabis sativa]